MGQMSEFSTKNKSLSPQRKPEAYSGFIFTFEPGRSEIIDAKLRYKPHEVTVTLSSKDWNLLPRELVVLSLFPDDAGIDGIALMDRAPTNTATATWKLRIYSPVMFERPIRFSELPQSIRGRKIRSTPVLLRRLTKMEWSLLVERLKKLRPDQRNDIQEVEAKRSMDRRIFPTNVRNIRLMEERDAIGTALDIAGLDRGGVLKRLDTRRLERATSVLDLLDFEPLHEQDVIRHDEKIFGSLFREGMRHARLMGATGTEVRVHVYDKKALETIVGLDLLIYQELFDAFILVQYKMMKRSGENTSWSYGVDRQMQKQLGAMSGVTKLIASKRSNSRGLKNWRLSDEVFFWKFCEATRRKDFDGALIHGITLSRQHLENFLSLPQSRSKGKARRIGYANCQRYLTNTQFVDLARSGWIGGGANASAAIQEILAASQRGGRRAILALIKSAEAIDNRPRRWGRR